MSQSGGRRTPARGPRTTPGGRKPRATARPAPRGSGGRPSSAAPTRPARPARPAAAPAGPRPRITSRAAVLVVIVAVLAVSYASSLKAYLQQRDHIQDAQERIAASEATIADLEKEKQKFEDPAYIEQQARARFGYVMPGERPFVVLRGGEPIDVEGSLSDPDSIDPSDPPPWWDDAWTTMEIAGDPPRKTDPPPLTLVDEPDGAPDQEGSP
ncbi:FtsB family cell division protein [Nocardioides dongxiaopingii]|uniref:FtsB family cell division protein n=1 Tax=Nocardioides dongxiaopingii TaxID=2576036 RepID=UPI001BB01E89|nr:septum formation initiator family protein [Nocardioides dongxiaopingii]